MEPPGYFELILGLSHSKSALSKWSGCQPRQDPADLGCAVPIDSHQTTPMTSLSPPQHAIIITIPLSGLARFGRHGSLNRYPNSAHRPSLHSFLGLYPQRFRFLEDHIFIRLQHFITQLSLFLFFIASLSRSLDIACQGRVGAWRCSSACFFLGFLDELHDGTGATIDCTTCTMTRQSTDFRDAVSYFPLSHRNPHTICTLLFPALLGSLYHGITKTWAIDQKDGFGSWKIG